MWFKRKKNKNLNKYLDKIKIEDIYFDELDKNNELSKDDKRAICLQLLNRYYDGDFDIEECEETFSINSDIYESTYKFEYNDYIYYIYSDDNNRNNHKENKMIVCLNDGKRVIVFDTCIVTSLYNLAQIKNNIYIMHNFIAI